MSVKRKHFVEVAYLCQIYDYAGAYWDGNELTFYSWRRYDGPTSDCPTSDDWLEPCASTGLKESHQKYQWLGLERWLYENKIENFSYGYSLNF